MRRMLILAALLALADARAAMADRVQVFSVQAADCGDCEREIAPGLKKLKGVKAWGFDRERFEFTITLADGVPDQAVVAVFERQGCYRAVPGAGHGAKPGAFQLEPYPEGADVKVVTGRGEAVGPLEKLRVPGKYTVLDFYADWCGPCRAVDKQLRGILEARKDVALRKLNVVSFESALARQLGRRLKALPYVVIFAPDGRRVEITGSDPKKLESALGGGG
ncbi:MAG TPA: thioredoxin family protein [Candidatus Eisenbacteria bacterium]